MNIAILTHPLGANYGGILQAYALSRYLEKLGHSVIVLNRQPNHNILFRLIKGLLVLIGHPRYNNPRFSCLRNFVKNYMNYSKPLSTTRSLNRFLRINRIDAVIVGSDQVWRQDFAMNYNYNYFLDFVPDEMKKVAYAASFGLNIWNYTQEQTNEIKLLLERFSAISVREDDGVILCRKYLCSESTHVLDPTLLLNVEEYEKIMSPRLIDEKYVFVYWLGNEDDKIKALEKYTNKKIVDISLRGNNSLISIGDWLSYIKYADDIVTDSFHGCVFSLLFQKQFHLNANDSGGNGRLSSLFRMLDIVPLESELNYRQIGKK